MKTTTIAEKPMDECQTCGKPDDCRPYGPDRKMICYDCGTATPQMRKVVENNKDSEE